MQNKTVYSKDIVRQIYSRLCKKNIRKSMSENTFKKSNKKCKEEKCLNLEGQIKDVKKIDA